MDSVKKIGLLDNFARGWIGDPVIHHGLTRVIAPELWERGLPLLEVPGWSPASIEEMDRRLERCGYIVKCGTPSWSREYDERAWNWCLKTGTHISFLGIGTSISELALPWQVYMSADQRRLSDVIRPLICSGLIDVVIVRDALAERLWKALGCPPDRIVRMPCPGTFSFEPRPRVAKKIVALDVADDRICSKARNVTFTDYYLHLHYIREGLRRRGCEIRIQTHEADIHYLREKGFPDVVQFGSREEMVRYYAGIDVYIGAKVHGALPCAGSGAPALLFGVDGRQSAAWEVPDIVTVDIESGIWHPERVLAWWDRLDPEAVSQRLLAYREKRFGEWRKVIERLVAEIGITRVEAQTPIITEVLPPIPPSPSPT